MIRNEYFTMHVSVLICTHNRAELLARAIRSLNAAQRPCNATIDILVIANACTDGTVKWLSTYEAKKDARQLFLRWSEEPIPGKSNALNYAIPLIEAPLVAFVDDDHKVDVNYLIALCSAAEAYPDATLFCGRILPDWDGREPKWAHDTGPYSIYPLPVPRYDKGDLPKEITDKVGLPGGGNLFLRREVFDRIGGFSTELGPHGHDLGGGEDSDFVARALAAGERLQYVPDVVQYHYVEPERFYLRYLLRKSYQRSRSVTCVEAGDSQGIPRYLWRKLIFYILQAVFSMRWQRTRFYLVRIAATLGEIRGFHRAYYSHRPSSKGNSTADQQ